MSDPASHRRAPMPAGSPPGPAPTRPGPARPAAAASSARVGAGVVRPIAPPAARSVWRENRPVLVLLGILVTLNLAGLPYYALSPAQRVRHPLHDWLKSSGYIGQSAGIGAFLLFLFLWLYPLRKKFRWLSFTGSIARWLDVHIVAGLCIPLLGAMHAAWRFTGLIGLGYAALIVVALSGIVGKYLYVRIPRRTGGLEMSLEEIEAERVVLQRYIAGATGMTPEEVESILTPNRAPYEGLGFGRTVARMIRDDFDRWRAARRLIRDSRAAARGRGRVDRKVMALVRRLARRQMALSQQVRLLDATHRLFRFWHVAHRPVAITALVAVAVHVGVAVATGMTWFH